MKIGITTIIAFLVVTGFCVAQDNDLYKDPKRASTNIWGEEFPRVDSQSEVIFRVNAPDAQKVQVDILKVYIMEDFDFLSG